MLIFTAPPGAYFYSGGVFCFLWDKSPLEIASKELYNVYYMVFGTKKVLDR
ncbi:hypothetical protein DCCM_4005 [Desulfocucumis palustris]|uniref:Uncharacterized protein n=1 Tax=Desulfocucumis palustris TaxID=1898651 RepID=A0A2L2XF75_9FIRM|nr:hypothetical protein DCCM_4005 [Desulfocucumis palustris]